MKFLNAGELDDALDACAREPVHIPGAIQPHGALVAMDADLRQVSQVSANIEAILGVSVADVLAASPGAWDGGRFLEQIQAQLEAPGRSGA